MRLIITRHGETEENKNNILQGQLGGNLSKKGIEQAKRLASRLQKEKIDKIFSSDLTRAADTAREIYKFHNSIPFELAKELRERYFGILQGKRIPVDWSVRELDMDFAKKLQIETPEDLFERAKNFLGGVLKNNKEKTILFVTHNSLGQAIITYILGKEFKDMNKLGVLEGTSVSIFEFDDEGNPTQKLFNCTSHLN